MAGLRVATGARASYALRKLANNYTAVGLLAAGGRSPEHAESLLVRSDGPFPRRESGRASWSKFTCGRPGVLWGDVTLRENTVEFLLGALARNVRMAIQYFAKVRSAADHEAFQRVVKHYPSCTFEEWHFRETKKMADWKGRRHAVKLVEIRPAEFTDYCKRTGRSSDITPFLAAVSGALVPQWCGDCERNCGGHASGGWPSTHPYGRLG